MPTYEYACKECAEHVEVVQSFKDEPLTECPACGGPLRKVFAPVGIVLKGSGFYKTDSRAATGGSKGPKKEAAKEASSSTSTPSARCSPTCGPRSSWCATSWSTAPRADGQTRSSTARS